MPFNLAAVLSLVTGVLAVAVTIATWLVSERFFQRLVAQQPELADSFPRPSLLTQYGPILPSKQAYLKGRHFNELSDPALKQLGQLSFALLAIHAVAVVVFMLCLLWWATARELT